MYALERRAGRTTVNGAINLGQVYSWVRLVLDILDELCPRRQEVATVPAVR